METLVKAVLEAGLAKAIQKVLDSTKAPTNINTGICQHRLQEGKPSFFVNWRIDGTQQYKFFVLRYRCYKFEQSLKNIALQESNTREFPITKFFNKLKGILDSGDRAYILKRVTTHKDPLEGTELPYTEYHSGAGRVTKLYDAYIFTDEEKIASTYISGGFKWVELTIVHDSIGEQVVELSIVEVPTPQDKPVLPNSIKYLDSRYEKE